MAIASFASKTFLVNSKKLYTFDEFTLGTSLQIEEQDVKDKKPSTYIKAPDLDKMSISIPLKANLGHNVMLEYEDWKGMMESETAHPFILGKKSISNTKWIIVSCNLSSTQINDDGLILSGVIMLEFQEYIRPGSTAASKSTKKTTSKAKAKTTKVDIGTLVNGTDKGNKKRSNPNANVAAAKGTKKGV